MDKSRRQILRSSAAGAALCAAPGLLPKIVSAQTQAYTNEPNSDRVVLGFTVPQSGSYSDEGADELRGFELAVDHLNGIGDGGMMNTMQPSSLQGNGILGRTVDYVVADTETRSDAARAAATRLIDDEGAVMIAGGSSSGVAISMQEVCQQKGVVFMAGLTHSNDTTGIDGSKNGFRYFLNAYMSNNALATYLTRQYQGPRKVYYLTADYSWGYSNEASFIAAFEPQGWETVAQVKTPLAQQDFTEYLNPVIESGADTLIMSHYGANMVNILTGASSLGLQNLQANGNEFVMAIPVYSQLMARGAGSNLTGVYGSMNWHSSLTDAASRAFTNSFNSKYGKPPSSAAHTCYVQTLLYADACERAGTFYPCSVVAELQGHRFDGLGNGVSEYRASDHQCFKSVLIGKGKASPDSEYDLVEVVDTIPASDVTYSTGNEQFNTNHGECFDGFELQAADGTSSNSLGSISNTGSSDNSSGGGSVGAAGLAAIAAAYLARRKLTSNES